MVIGRDSSSALRLTDKGVNDRHAAIERGTDGYYVRDLGSANGVRVNGQRITDQRLTTGDEIEVGGVRLAFEIVHEPPPGRRALDPLQLVAVCAVALVIAGQGVLFGWIFSQPHPRRGRTDIVKSARQQRAAAAAPAAPTLLPPLPAMDVSDIPTPATEVLDRMIKIVRVDRVDAPDAVTVRIQVKAQVGERQLDTGSVGIGVQFFTSPTTGKSPVWVAVPLDWGNFSTRTLSAKFFGPPQQCAGYVVRAYYRKKLQDVFAAPSSLARSP